MAKAQDVRPIIKLRSTAGTGYTYVTRKNRRNNPDRLVLKSTTPLYVSTLKSPTCAKHG
jgi:large subunit ribosomal protein L33